VDNSSTHQVHGACNPAAALGGRRIDAMVVGGIGAGAIMKLNALSIKVFSAGAEKVGENIDLLKENKLREITAGDACGGHQGQCGH
jgi:predicted Fe-Mo cluster-binding NifX family protein